ncbi:MAG: alkaline phosphatase family protein [Proteobacteria bacterium]|nr:alkaline phosphatase family protein [Pseudomonadota bacterium]
MSIDSLHPNYLTLDASGSGTGSEGNWLLPNLRKFLDQSVHYPQARCFLPSATDMNQLNAVAGTSSAQTGILGVWAQPSGWDNDGNIVLSTSDFATDLV